MKGLLIKDLYMMKAYCKMYILMTAVFLAVSLFNDNNSFFLIYPCMLCGMLPVSMLAYDERSRFLKYEAVLPPCKTKYVSAKYILCISLVVGVWLLSCVAYFTRMIIVNNFDFGLFMEKMTLILPIGLTGAAVSLPFMFKYGVEKGRIVYYVIIGVMCALGVAVSDKGDKIYIGGYTFLYLAICIAVFALSWILSIRLYKNREL